MIPSFLFFRDYPHPHVYSSSITTHSASSTTLIMVFWPFSSENFKDSFFREDHIQVYSDLDQILTFLISDIFTPENEKQTKLST